MTDKQTIRTSNITIVLLQELNNAIKNNERLQLSIEGIVKDGLEISDLLYAVSVSFPLVVFNTLTGQMLSALEFNHQVNDLCFDKMQRLYSQEEFNAAIKKLQTDDILAPIEAIISEESQKLLLSFKEIIQRCEVKDNQMPE